VGTRSIALSKDIVLKLVLLVPNLNCNLLSISKLTSNLDCIAKFSKNVCEFQKRTSGKMIGSAEARLGLYLLTKTNFEGNLAQFNTYSTIPSVCFSNSSTTYDSAILLWHYRLGHPNFVYLRKLFPSLFKSQDPHKLHCEICQYSKHVRNNYPSQNYISSHPFSLIHSDVWGPSRVKNITGSH